MEPKDEQDSATDLSIVIVSYECKDFLRSCLDSITSQSSDLKIEVFVVDNDSRDGTGEMVRAEFPMMKLVQNTTNLGFPAAANQGLTECTGQYVLLLNPDTVVPPGALRSMVAYMSVHPDCGIAGPELVNGDGTPQRGSYAFPTVRRMFVHMLRLDELFSWITGVAGLHFGRLSRQSTRCIDYVSGASLMIRRRTFKEIGLLDEGMFWAEDADWCFRARAAGWRVCTVTSVAVVHHGGQSMKSNVFGTVVAQYSSKIRFFEKHYGGSRALALRALFLLETISKYVALSLGSLIAPSRPSFGERRRAYRSIIASLMTGSPS